MSDPTTDQVTDPANDPALSDLSPRTGPTDAAPAPRRRRRWLPIVLIGLVLAAGGVIVTQFLRSAVDYYCNVDEIGVRNGCDAGRRLRLQGVVQNGTIDYTGTTTEFVISFNGVTVPVAYNGDPGGIFKDCMPVIVHGRFDGEPGTPSAVFNGDLVEVKHSNEYVAENDARLDEAEQLAARCEAAGA
jgi:cytochrome c-type biogenesis protein CcmE